MGLSVELRKGANFLIQNKVLSKEIFLLDACMYDEIFLVKTRCGILYFHCAWRKYYFVSLLKWACLFLHSYALAVFDGHQFNLKRDIKIGSCLVFNHVKTTPNCTIFNTASKVELFVFCSLYSQKEQGRSLCCPTVVQ